MKKTLKKIFSILYRIVEALAIGLIIIFIAFVLIQRFSNNKFSILGYRMFNVESSSMSPTYVVGDIIIIKTVDPDTLEIGDDVTYLGKESNLKGMVITHRIVDIATDENGETIFQTKGINNDAKDPVITEDQIYGKLVMKARLLSKINKSIQTREGFYLWIFIPLAFIIGSELVVSGVERYKEKHNILD